MIQRSSLRAACGFVGLALLAGTPAPGQKIRSAIPVSRVPAWVHEAAGHAAPESAAPIVWLHRELIVEPLEAGGVRETRRRVGKLLRQSGADALGIWGVAYGKRDRLVSFDAWTLRPDGTARRAVDDRRNGDIYDLPFVSASSVYEDRRQRVANAPGVVPGAVVAHESVVERHIDVGAAPFLFGAADEPTAFSRLSLVLPPEWKWDASRFRDEAIRVNDSANAIHFSARDLRALPFEEERPPADELLPMVWVRWWGPDGERGFRDWDAVGRWFERLSAPVLEDRGEAAVLGAGLKPDEPGRILEALDAAFAYVSREIRYVSIQVGIGGYRPSSPAAVAANRYGDCKDKTFLLRSLVDDWVPKTYAVLVRTREMGDLPDEVPCPCAFNHAIAAVELPDGVGDDLWATAEVEGLGRLLFLDATVSQSDARSLPPAVQGTTALVVHPNGGTLVRLPVQPSGSSTLRITMRSSVDEQGVLRGARITRERTGFEAAAFRAELSRMSEADRRRGRETEVQSWCPAAAIHEYTLKGTEDPGQPVAETILLDGGKAGKRVGDLLILEPGRPAAGFVSSDLPPPPREWDLQLDYPREQRVEVRFELPAGWVPEELPEALELRGEDLTAEIEWGIEDDSLVFRAAARLLTQEVPAGRYESFRDAAMRLARESARPVVLIRQEDPSR